MSFARAAHVPAGEFSRRSGPGPGAGRSEPGDGRSAGRDPTSLGISDTLDALPSLRPVEPSVDTRAAWRRVHRAFDPVIPAGDPSHEQIVRVDRPHSPVSSLLERLAFPEGHLRALVVGASGSGKTTELLALARKVRDLRVVLVDLHEHFREQRGDEAALDRLQPWEVLVVVGLAVYRYGRQVLGHRWSEGRERALREAIGGPAQRDPASIDLPALAAEVALLVADAAKGSPAGLALRGLAAAARGVSLTLPLGRARQQDDLLGDQDERVQGLLHAVSALIRELVDGYGKGLLLLVDGVDRGSPDLARRLFEDSETLARLPCHQVMTAPLSLRQRNLRGGWRCFFLGNIPVIDPHAEDVYEPGPETAFFVDLWRERAKAAGVPIDWMSEDDIRRLGWASGGLIRTHCEMVQDVARRGWAANERSTPEMLEQVIDEWRRRWEEDLTQRDVDILREVADLRRLPGEDPREQELLDQRCIVAWPNRSRWYFPHPLLLLNLVRIQRPGPA